MATINRKLFNECLNDIYNQAEEKFLQYGETSPSMVVAKNEKNSTADTWNLDLHIFSSFDESRYEMMESLGSEYGTKRERVVAVFLATEAWISQRTKEEWENTENHVRPSEDPNRLEALVVTGMAIDAHVDMISAFIEREDGVITLNKRDDLDGIFADSPLIKSFFRGFTLAYLATTQH